MNSKSELRLALAEWNRRKMECLPSNEELEGAHTFSEEFEARIEEIARRYRKRFVEGTHYTLRKSWVAAAILILALSLSMSVEASRKAIIHFFVEMFDRYSDIRYDEVDVKYAPDRILEYREPDWGEEYEVVERTEVPYLSVTVYNVEKNLLITYRQSVISDVVSRVNTENVVLFEIYLKNNIKAKYYKNNNVMALLWSDEYFYSLEGECTLENLIEIAELMYE